MREAPHWNFLSRRQDDAGRDEGGAALELLEPGLLLEDGAHVGPLPNLGLTLAEALDPSSQTVHVPLPAAADVLHLGRRRLEVRIPTADLQESRALALVWVQGREPVPDIDEPLPVGDDGAVGALVVGDTLVAQLIRVVTAILEPPIALHLGLADLVGV